MARLLDRIVEDPRPCSYLPQRTASLEHVIQLDTTAEELEALLVRGWRRFGPDYFRPRCTPCHDCVPTRVPVAAFVPSKSQRRARRACAGLHIDIGRPRVDPARLELYARWHAARELARGWEPAPIDPRSYHIQFAFPHPAAREISYYDGDRLVGIAISDETTRAWSAVYFFYAPEWARRSIGTFNVLKQLEIASALGIPHVYLGYRVVGCRSMEYKSLFSPQERLVGWPGPDEEPRWETVS